MVELGVVAAVVVMAVLQVEKARQAAPVAPTNLDPSAMHFRAQSTSIPLLE